MTQLFRSLQKRVVLQYQPERRSGTSRPTAGFIGGSLWAITGQVLAAVGMVLGVRVITEYVSPSTFGTVSLLMGMVTLGFGVCGGPIFQALLRMYSDIQRQNRLPFLMTEIRRLLIESYGVLIAAGMAVGLILWFLSEVNIAVLLILGGLAVLEALRGVVTTVLSAQNNIKTHAFMVAGDIWVKQSFAVLLVIILGASVTSIIGGYLVGAVLLSLWYVRILRGNNNRSATLNESGQGKQLRQEIIKFSRPLMPIALAGWVSGLGDRYVIGGILGVEAAGIYAAVYALVSKPFLMISTALELALRQSYYRTVSVDDERGQRKVMFTWVMATLVASILCLAFVTIWADEITRLFLSEKFKSGVDLMPWIAAGYALFTLSAALERRAYAYKKTGSVLKIQAGGAIASVLVGTIGTYCYGLLGAAWAVPVYFGCQLALAVYLTRELPRSSSCSKRDYGKDS